MIGDTEERRVVDELHSYFTKGSWEQNPSRFTIECSNVPRPIDERSIRKNASVHVDFTHFKIRLFGATIPLGLARAEIVNVQVFYEAVAEARRLKSTRVVLENPKFRFTIVEPSTEEPSSALTDKSGSSKPVKRPQKRRSVRDP